MNTATARKVSTKDRSISPAGKSPARGGDKSDRIKVFVRFKPLTERERERLRKQVEYCSESELIINAYGYERKRYTFDRVFGQQSGNSEVYEQACGELVEGMMAAGHGLVFVYGNTGTGKTYTMGLLEELTNTSEGIVPEGLRQLFQRCSGEYTISISFCEIYMEEVYDLLSVEDRKLCIRETAQKDTYVENLLKIKVNTVQEAFKLVNIGLEQRRVAEQKLNRNSSRSHALLTVYLKHNGTGTMTKLCFVDLAGSERLKESESKGINLSEAVHINSSLSALETLLINLSSNSHPTYRSNKLTRLLQPYFEQGRISLIVTHNSENVQPIEFAKRCKGIKFIEKKEESHNRSQYSNNELEKKDSSLTARTQENERLLYYVNCLVGLLSKINQYIGDLAQKAEPATKNFNVHELMGLKQRPAGKGAAELNHIENKLNCYLKELDEKERTIRLLEVKVEEPQNIMNRLDDNKNFINEVQNLGKSILANSRYLHELAQHRKSLRQQIATAQLKCHILEKKGKRGEEVIEFLVNRIDRTKITEVCERMKSMGVQIELGGQSPSSTRPQTASVGSLPQPRSKPGFIYIDEQHANL